MIFKTFIPGAPLFIAIFMLLVVSGCATHSDTVVGPPLVDEPILKVQSELLSYYKDWHATPHRLGGNTRRGLDCSAFVKNAYQSVFEMQLPRTTVGQSELGEIIKKSAVLPGDLVFFKISRRVRHVGIVINDNQFMHVSEKKGVMLSALDNVYWRKKYWKAVRPDNGLH